MLAPAFIMDTGVFVFHTVLEGCLGAIFLARGR